jgi:energy-coupling factor transporter ATP-binding protein EcfA2
MTLPDLQGELWAWVQSLPPWQSDLLRRLTTLEEVTQDALDEALRMVLTAHALPSAPPVAPVPIPALVAAAQPRATKILALRDLVAVGSVEAAQRLDFGSDGLTVVFGETGSGKSSYARVLRRACRSSAKPVEILPNVLKAGPGVGQVRAGTAQIEVSIDGTTRQIGRDVNSAPEPDLAEVSVFDSDCAHVYADGESEITYTPSSLQLFERLVAFQAQIKKKVDEEIARLVAQQVPTDGFDPTTKAGALVAALTDHVSPATVDALATVTATERSKLDELRAQLASARANDPSKAATQLEKRADAAERFVRQLDAVAQTLDSATVSALLAIDARGVELVAQSEALSAALSRVAARPVGSAEWKTLWHAAHAYVARSTGGKETFPPDDEHPKALCPLCQQTIPDDARRRLQSFETFFRGEVERQLRDVGTERAAIVERVAKAEADLASLGSPLALLLSGEGNLEATAASFLQSAARRAQAIRTSSEGSTIDAPPVTPEPMTGLRAFAVDVRRKAAEQRGLAAPDAIAKVTREIAELEGRLRLHERREAVLSRIETLKRIAKLRSASGALATTGLSRRIGEFTESAVTAQLRARLVTELEALRCTHLPVAIGARGMKGKTKVSLELDATRNVGVGDVLSEGERRAVALSFFLAEVGTAEHGGGVVLDDPVSSLDHARRAYVAQRLVEEATRRQVIVFTHDVVFLLDLQDRAARASVPCEARVVLRVGNTAGIAAKDLPWVVQNVSQRIGYLRKEAQTLAALERKGETERYRREAKTWFELLREAWERSVEEKLFNGVVGRFQPGIQTMRLRPVNVTAAMTAAVEQGMTRASEWTHDQAPALGRPPPTAADVKAALDDLEAFTSQFKR